MMIGDAMSNQLLRPAQAWDGEYQRGRWDYLHGVAEMPRYAVVAGYVRRFAAGGRVLDAGCGQALLHEYVGDCVATYLGVDLSAAALTAAGARRGRTLLVGDLETFSLPPGPPFDALVLNEVLYYCRDPQATLARWARALRPGGVAIVSMYEAPSRSSRERQLVDALWEGVARGPYVTVDETVVTSVPAGRTWRIRVLGER
jgi:SAM-dependent methyltransferase